MKVIFGKIVVLTFLSIFMLHFASIGQNFYGVTLGADASKLTGGDVYGGMNYITTPGASFTFGVKIKTDWNIQSGIYYVTTGVNQKFTYREIINTSEFDTPLVITRNRIYNNTLKLSYIQVPILLKKSFSLKGGIYPYQRAIGPMDIDFYIGPYFGYRFGSSAKMSTVKTESRLKNGSTTNGPESSDTLTFRIGQHTKVSVKPSNIADTGLFPVTLFEPLAPKNNPDISGLNSFDAGLILGTGLSFEVSPYAKVFCGVKYSMGLLSIDKEYFADVNYQFVQDASGTYTVAGSQFKINTIYTPMDLKNSSVGIFFGYLKYVGSKNY